MMTINTFSLIFYIIILIILINFIFNIFFLSKNSKYYINKINIISNKIITLFLLYLIIENKNEITYLCFNGIFKINILPNTIFIFNLLLYFFFIIFFDIWKSNKKNNFEYLFLCTVILLSIFVLIYSNDILSFFLGFELQSICLYGIALINTKSERSLEAGLRYFLLSILSSSLILFGFSLIYYVFGGTNFDAVYINVMFLENYSNNFKILYSLGSIFSLSGLLFKLSLAPFYFWSPDLYDSLYAKTAVIFSVITKPSIIVPSINIIFFNNNFMIKYFIYLICIFSILISCFIGIKQKRLKKILAFSSILNSSYILIGISIISLDSICSALLLIFTYLTTNLSIWILIEFFEKNIKTLFITKFKHFRKTLKIELNYIFLFLISIAGLPPFIGFLPKYFLINNIIENNLYILAGITFFVSIISLFFYIRPIKIILIEDKEFKKKKVVITKPLDKNIAIIISSSAFFILLSFYFSNIILKVCLYITLLI